MTAFDRTWEVYVINHSHTDIGYTDRQEKIARYHRDYIREVIWNLNEIHRDPDKMKEFLGYKWECENYWQVKQFYVAATEEEKADFEKYVKSGEIGLSGNYLNMTELVSDDVLNEKIGEAEIFSKQIGVPIHSAMTADINGFAWGYVDALYNHGVKRLYSCLHPHHGMFPLYRKVIPFFWEGPNGNKILVWNGEHYHFGNEMFLAPHAGSSYMTLDEFNEPLNHGELFKTSAGDTDQKELEIAKIRLERYIDNLRKEDYPFDFVPFMVSGAITDNAPSGIGIMHRLNQLNEAFGGHVHFQMATLEQFFDVLQKESDRIPTYKGDWNDWWADGVSSTPAATKVYLDARRKYDLCNKMDPERKLSNPQLLENAAEDLMLYAEHTWGYSSSVSEPWERLVNELEMKKGAYAINASTRANRYLDDVLACKGEVTLRQGRKNHYRIINPHDHVFTGPVYLYIEFWEYIEGTKYDESVPIRVVDAVTGEELCSQVKTIARAVQIEVEISLEPHEVKNVRIELAEKKPYVVENHPYIGAEGVRDIIQPDVYREDIQTVETADFLFAFDQTRGIRSILDKRNEKELLQNTAEYPAFTGIYEITETNDTPFLTRRKMGRNRKSPATRKYFSKFRNIEIAENGAAYVTVRLDYELQGTEIYGVMLKIYKKMTRFDATVRIHKTSKWYPENLYISLPFTVGSGESRYIDKTGCVIRPGIDQLPGTNQEFYMIQDGIAMIDGDERIGIAVKDAPLLHFGTLEAKSISLCDGKNITLNRDTVYSWVMNNFWETNFKVDLGGFYEFGYSVFLADGKQTPEAILNQCREMNEGAIAFNVE